MVRMSLMGAVQIGLPIEFAGRRGVPTSFSAGVGCLSNVTGFLVLVFLLILVYRTEGSS